MGACVDTSKVNAAASRPIYVIAQPMMQGWQPIQQAPAETEARDVVARTETEAEAEAEIEAGTQSRGKGKEPMRSGDVVEHDVPSGSQA